MIIFNYVTECINTSELTSHIGRVMPMVVNPIYETGAIYEEIPGATNFKPNSEPTAMEKEEGYVSISSSATTNIPQGKCDSVSLSTWGWNFYKLRTCEGIKSLF